VRVCVHVEVIVSCWLTLVQLTQQHAHWPWQMVAICQQSMSTLVCFMQAREVEAAVRGSTGGAGAVASPQGE
jgi:hypothetical protein